MSWAVVSQLISRLATGPMRKVVRDATETFSVTAAPAKVGLTTDANGSVPTMPRTHDMAAAYGCSVAQLFEAFSDRTYWIERLEKSGCDAVNLDELTTRPDGGLDIATTQIVRFARLPSVVAQFHSGDLTLVRTESWEPIVDGRTSGTITGAVPGAPVRVTGAAALRDSADDAQLDVHVVIEVRIPLVGGKIENFIGGQLAEMVRLEQEFTTEWIREHI